MFQVVEAPSRSFDYLDLLSIDVEAEPSFLNLILEIAFQSSIQNQNFRKCFKYILPYPLDQQKSSHSPWACLEPQIFL